MRLNLAAFIDAVRLHLSPAVAAAIPAAAASMAGTAEAPEAISDADAGELILRVLLGRSDWPAQPVELSLLHLMNPAEPIQLDPADVATHPLFVGIPSTLSEAVGAPIVAGARGSFMALGFPNFTQVDVVRADSGIYGALHFHVQGSSGAQSCMAQYGALTSVPMMQTSTVMGAGLYEVGRQARAATQSSGAPPAPPVSGGFRVVGVEAIGSGSVH